PRSRLLELRDVGRRQLAPRVVRFTIAQPLRHFLRLGTARAVRTEVPAGLQRAPAMRASAADPLAALRARLEIHADRRAPAGTQRALVAHFGHHAQQFLSGRDAALHLREPVLAERDHPAGDRAVADLILRRARRDQPPQLVVDAHHLVDADAASIAGVVALIA